MTDDKKLLGYCVPGCVDYQFDDEFWVSTMVTEWDLVCEKSWLKTLAKMLLFTGFALGSQQDAAECLRQLLRDTRLGQRYCDSQADVVDGSVVICYTPEAAQVSVAAAAVDARALRLEATTGDGS